MSEATLSPTQPIQGLAYQLKVGTQKAHTMAESTSFVTSFLKGIVDRQSYAKLVTNFYYVYSTLEAELTRHQHHPILGKLYYPELWRRDALEQDLAYYYGADWQAKIQPSTACAKYMHHLKQTSEQQPILLIAHAYTRYMGDLSGGQILKKIAKQAMNLTDGQGTAFYDFEEIKNHGEFKKQYRAALDNLDLDPETTAQVVSEANQAFHLNMELFHELEGNWLLTLGKMAWHGIARKFAQPKA
ncbi:MAG: biliverdin-producing heme oxygenase [Pseudanabaenaceae cyanobacterium bins.68]|nr:biliverdin-producing heme oxygenase [Pseudanabaenaceae cyanobacterium bins.68]